MTPRRTNRSVGVAALLASCACAVLTPAVARAQTPAENREGHALFDQGYASYQALDYAAALPLFQRAFVLTRNAAMLYNIGATLEHLNRRAEAATALRRYLSAVPDAANRAEVEARVAQLETSEAPSSSPTSAAPVMSTVASSSPPPPNPIVVHPRERPIWPWIALGGGVLVAGAGILVSALAPDPALATDEMGYVARSNQAASQHIAGGVMMGVGFAAVVASIVGLATPNRGSDASHVAWGAFPTRDGGGLFVSVRSRGF